MRLLFLLFLLRCCALEKASPICYGPGHVSHADQCPQLQQYVQQWDTNLARGDVAEVVVTHPLDNVLQILLELLPAAVQLGTALTLNVSQYPKFLDFLRPAAVDWSTGPSAAVSPGVGHTFHFPGGRLVLRTDRSGTARRDCGTVAEVIAAAAASTPNNATALSAACLPCAVAGLFKKAPFAEQLQRKVRGQIALPAGPYTAWHSSGAGWQSRARPVGDDLRACGAYQAAARGAPNRTFLASRRHRFKWFCGRTAGALAHFADLGLDGPHAPNAAASEFLDLFFMLDASVLVHDGSPIARFAAAWAGMQCADAPENLVKCVAVPSMEGPSPLPPASNELDPVDSLEYPVARMHGPGQQVQWYTAGALRQAQQLLFDWQNPTPARCLTARFLVYTPVACGIGSMIHTAISALSAALCLGRILVVRGGDMNCYRGPAQWANHSACRGRTNWLECYVQPITSCSVDPNASAAAPFLTPATHRALGRVRYVAANKAGVEHGIPCGPCAYCKVAKHFPRAVGGLYSKFRALFPGRSPAAVATLMRYVFRPQDWLLNRIRHFLQEQPKVLASLRPPTPFAAVHVRYGDKKIEVKPHPLKEYMQAVRRLGLQRVFVSTETASVLDELRDGFRSYTFFSIEYKRKGEEQYGADPAAEFVASFANLAVALQGAAFVGTDSSNWCRLIHEYVITSPANQRRYIRLDTGAKAYDVCFP